MEIQLLQVGGQKPAKTTMPAIWVVFFKYAIYIYFSLLLVVQKSGKLTSWGNGSLSQYLQGFSTIPDGCLICLAFLPSTVVLWLNDSCTFYSQTYLVFFQHFCRRSTDLKPTYTPLKHWKPAYGLSNKKLSLRIHGNGIFTYIWLLFMRNIGKYTIHGSYGYKIYLNSSQTNKQKQLRTGWWFQPIWKISVKLENFLK